MNRHLLDRRQFNALCALGLSLPTAGTMIAALSGGGSALAAGADTSLNAAGHTVKFQDGSIVPAVGQGSWHLGQGKGILAAPLKEEALRLGVSLGMRLIDTAENYGAGRSEELISHAIAGQRDRVFLVSKVETNHVTGDWHRPCLRIRALPVVSALTISISICCTGRSQAPSSPAS